MFLNDDDMVECPYNKTHRMLRKRLQSHLLKCRLNYPDVELRKCPFNITHLIPEPEFTYHATNCSDRKLITQYKYDAPEPKEEEGPKHAPIECEENWDDTDVNDYNPKLYLESANVIRKPEGANPSERKMFIKKERKRLGNGDDSFEEDETEDNAASVSTIDNNIIGEAPVNSKSHSPRSYSEENCARKSSKKYSTSPSTSSCSKGRSRSPSNKYKRGRSRSPLGFRRSHRDHSPSRRRSPDYSRHYSPPSDSIGRTLYSYNSDQDPYYNGGSSASNNPSFSGRDPYYSNGNHSQSYYDRNTETQAAVHEAPPPPMISYPATQAYHDRNTEIQSALPQAPPPPMISYPAPRSYLTTKSSRPSSDY